MHHSAKPIKGGFEKQGLDVGFQLNSYMLWIYTVFYKSFGHYIFLGVACLGARKLGATIHDKHDSYHSYHYNDSGLVLG